MSPSKSFPKPKQLTMDKQELDDAVTCCAGWIFKQMQEASIPLQKFPSFVRPKQVTQDDGSLLVVLNVRWTDPASGGFFERRMPLPHGADPESSARIMRHVLSACRGK